MPNFRENFGLKQNQETIEDQKLKQNNTETPKQKEVLEPSKSSNAELSSKTIMTEAEQKRLDEFLAEQNKTAGIKTQTPERLKSKTKKQKLNYSRQ